MAEPQGASRSARPLSVCMVTTFYPPHHFGGDATFVRGLSEALARRGHRVTVVHCVDSHEVLGGKVKDEPVVHGEGVSVRSLRSRLGPVSPLVTYLTGQPGPKAGALQQIFEEPFDVVHFHNVSLVGGPGILRYGDGIKLYTTHEYWLVCPMHTLWKYNRRPCDKPAWLPCTLSFGRPPQLWRYTGALARAVDEIDLFLAPSRFTLDKHRERGFSRPMRHLPYFVPAPSPPKRSANEDPPDPYFLFVGRLEKIKGVDTLLDVFARYKSAGLVVVGDGSQAGELRRRARSLPHVRFLGQRGGAELARLYADAVALVVPSLGYEVGPPLVTLEAFAMGTPAIVRRIGALPEAIEDSGGGFTYETESELVRSMDTLLDDPGLRQELGERGRLAWRERWSEEPHLARYLDLIDELRERRHLDRGASG